MIALAVLDDQEQPVPAKRPGEGDLPVIGGDDLGVATRFDGNTFDDIAVLADMAELLNHPATGVAWLANTLAPYGEFLEAGEVVLAGSFTRPVTAVAGDCFHADYGPLGNIAFRFV